MPHFWSNMVGELATESLAGSSSAEVPAPPFTFKLSLKEVKYTDADRDSPITSKSWNSISWSACLPMLVDRLAHGVAGLDSMALPLLVELLANHSDASLQLVLAFLDMMQPAHGLALAFED